MRAAATAGRRERGREAARERTDLAAASRKLRSGRVNIETRSRFNISHFRCIRYTRVDIRYGNDVGVVYCVIFSPCPSLPLSLAPGTREIDMAGILLVTFNLRERGREREERVKK